MAVAVTGSTVRERLNAGDLNTLNDLLRLSGGQDGCAVG